MIQSVTHAENLPQSLTSRRLEGQWTPAPKEQNKKTGIVGQMTLQVPSIDKSNPVKIVYTLNKDGIIIADTYDGLTGELIPREKTGNYDLGRNGRTEVDPESGKTVLVFTESFEPSYFQSKKNIKQSPHPKSIES